ncbi:MAG TPA: c-type cytochrome [Candidatus Acidoferrales bacterium]|nr:c-type cytochrome [Candidatus Acidoferrales bacterium]
MKDPSRRYRWLLLVSSLVTLVLLLAAAVRENYLSHWLIVQRHYRSLLAKKATDERGKELHRNFQIELRQVSLPGLKTVDRCVTCHVGIDDPRMTDVPQPYRVHPGDVLQNHPVDRFGCTVCHQGQGPATNFRDAKADDAYWDYPLLTAELTQSSCFSCHDPARLPADQAPLLLAGMKLYEEKSCGSCHRLNGRGGTLGPALDDEGSKTRHTLTMVNLKPPHTTWRWHQAHFRDPGGIVDGSQMKNPTVTEREALALTVYMLGLRQRDVPESYLAPDKIEQKYRALHPAPLAGEQLYRQYCFACHGNGAYGRWDKTFNRFIPALRGASLVATATPAYWEANIAQGRPGTQMPGWGSQAGGLQPAEIPALVDYLRSGAPSRAAVEPAPAKGDSARGLKLFAQNCAGCHGIGGRGGFAPELANATFQQAATDEFIATTIRHGRQGTAMPAFQRPGVSGLTDAELADLLAYVRSLGGATGQRAAASLSDRKQGGSLP